MPPKRKNLRRAPAEWTEIARQAILAVLDEHHAVLPIELEARLADHPYIIPETQEQVESINPHHLTSAKTQLLAERRIEVVNATTRGGSTIPVIIPTNRRLKETIVDRTAMRKRLLQSSFLKWSKASGKIPNLIGQGGEHVAHSSLLAAATHAAQQGVAYIPINPIGGGVTELLQSPIPIGPLDDAAWLVRIASSGLPTNIMVLIEVKNIREWIYPRTAELYQLLTKAATLQTIHAGTHFLPVLICRKCHRTTFRMAKDLGFFLIETHSQAVMPHNEAPDDIVGEINSELLYNLVRSNDANQHVVNVFVQGLPRGALEIAERWRSTVPVLGKQYDQLRNTSLSPSRRRDRMVELTENAIGKLGATGGWGAKDPKNDEDTDELLHDEEQW